MPAYIIATINITEGRRPPSRKRFYNSVEYQAAKQKRLGAADFHMIVVEGAN